MIHSLFTQKNIKKLILSALLICFATIIGAVTIRLSKVKEVDILNNKSSENIIIPINHIIDNSLSNLEETTRFGRDIERFMRSWDIKGGSFALMRNDSLIYAKGYGYASITDSINCDVNHLFRVASISKLITATAILKLQEDGLLDIEDKVFGETGILNDSIFLNIRDRNLKRINISHLLRHSAGFSQPIGDPAFNQEGVARTLNKNLPLSIDDMVIYATRNKLRSQPGGSFRYSNLGYIVLSKIIEKVSGKDYESYVKENILEPIGCYDMYIGKNFSINRKENEVDYYEVKEAEPIKAFDGSGELAMKSNGGNNVTLLSGAGGWIGSPVEILRFVASISKDTIKENILSKESIELMTLYDKKTRPIGWANVTKNEWFRSGSMAGTSALIKKQRNGYTWIFVSNSSSWNGPNLPKNMSTTISNAILKVKKWPRRDLFDINAIIKENKI